MAQCIALSADDSGEFEQYLESWHAEAMQHDRRAVRERLADTSRAGTRVIGAPIRRLAGSMRALVS